LCGYTELLERVQGRQPATVEVVLGGQEQVPLRTDDFMAYYRAVKRRLLDAVADAEPTYPLPVEHCQVCAWKEVCEAQWEDDDHLTLVAGLGREQARKLTDAGIATVSELAEAVEEARPPRMGEATFERLRRQARLQVTSAGLDVPRVERISTEDSLGLHALPAPSPGDVFFDLEGDPFAGDEGLEYLWGWGWQADDGSFAYDRAWAHTPTEERRAFERFVDWLTDRRTRYPDLHVYHYAAYERTVLGRLASRYATREDEVDRLLREDVLVDLHRVVRQGLMVGSRSYSIKELEPLYRSERAGEVTSAADSIIQYERWLREGGQEILDGIEDYNRDDCESTWQLRGWLLEQREKLIAEHGEPPPRPAQPERSGTEDVRAEVVALVNALTAGVADDARDRDADQQARWLLAQLLDWHRRENRPAWWSYFERVERMTEAELLADTEAIAGLSYVGVDRQEKQSLLHRYRFDPQQELKLRERDKPVDPFAKREDPEATTPGEVVELDIDDGELVLKRGKNSRAAHPRALVPTGPYGDVVKRTALQRLASSVDEHGVHGAGPYRAARDLLLAGPPRLRETTAEESLRRLGESASDAALRLVRELDHGCLAIQGPPGTGKSTTAARLIAVLLTDGRRVGITAGSHAVIGNLLDKVAHECGGMLPNAVQKVSELIQGADLDGLTVTKKNEEVDGALDAGVRLVAGTGWLFAREEMDQRLDVLVVDEAGQLALADALACSAAAANLVLVGDPQQLPQPLKGSHPPGAEASALRHLLGDHPVIPADRGLFLDQTFRLHPHIARFVSGIAYDDELEAAADRHRQAVGGDGDVSGAGLRWRPVVHEGNRTSSREEADVVAEVVGHLLTRSWWDHEGAAHPLDPHSGVVVVAPYNAQVAEIRAALRRHSLPDEVRVGTVDRFQGQEAAAVVISMAASTPDDVPRGIEFLYDLNRLNVAVSRAKALSVLVASPGLLEASCRTVRQMWLVNALCRYVEQAEPARRPGATAENAVRHGP